MFDSGCVLPTQVCDGRSRCFCGAVIGLRSMEQQVYTAQYSQDIRFDAFGTIKHI
jgi:hypothetical protein